MSQLYLIAGLYPRMTATGEQKRYFGATLLVTESSQYMFSSAVDPDLHKKKGFSPNILGEKYDNFCLFTEFLSYWNLTFGIQGKYFFSTFFFYNFLFFFVKNPWHLKLVFSAYSALWLCSGWHFAGQGCLSGQFSKPTLHFTEHSELGLMARASTYTIVVLTLWVG